MDTYMLRFCVPSFYYLFISVYHHYLACHYAFLSCQYIVPQKQFDHQIITSYKSQFVLGCHLMFSFKWNCQLDDKSGQLLYWGMQDKVEIVY